VGIDQYAAFAVMIHDPSRFSVLRSEFTRCTKSLVTNHPVIYNPKLASRSLHHLFCEAQTTPGLECQGRLRLIRKSLLLRQADTHTTNISDGRATVDTFRTNCSEAHR